MNTYCRHMNRRMHNMSHVRRPTRLDCIMSVLMHCWAAHNHDSLALLCVCVCVRCHELRCHVGQGSQGGSASGQRHGRCPQRQTVVCIHVKTHNTAIDSN